MKSRFLVNLRKYLMIIIARIGKSRWTRIIRSDSNSVSSVFSEIRRKPLPMNPVVIQGGLAPLVQPLDVSINKPFKDHAAKLWEDMPNPPLTSQENWKRMSYKEFADLVHKAWTRIDAEMIKKS